jgi:tetratricopeptide (TPR) repeat protein
MEERLIARRTRRERWQECKEFAAGTCYSVLVIIVALILLRPLMINHILSRASAYSAMGQIEESRRQCDKALLIDSESSQAWYGLARFYRVVGEREMALGAYQKATQADNTNKPAQFELGKMYVEDGLYEMAILCFEQVRRLGPDRARHGVAYHRDSLDTLASCYEQTGDLTKAELILEELRIFYPGHGNADERLARVKTGRTRPE